MPKSLRIMLLLLLLPLLLPTATSYYQCYQPVSLRHAMEFNIFFPSADLDNKVVETFVLPSLLYNGLNLAMAMSLLSLSLSLSRRYFPAVHQGPRLTLMCPNKK